MKYLNIDTGELERKGGYDTAKEISGQPDIWLSTYHSVVEQRVQLFHFLQKALRRKDICIILTGAGTSAFIGEALDGIFQRKLKICTKSIATTDIITHPEDYFIRTQPTLLISFARSGDSPESLAAVKMAAYHCDEIYQLIITCNAHGELVKNTTGENAYVFILPEKSNDKSLAMTSSFTSMLLAGLLMLDLHRLDDMLPHIALLHDCGNALIEENLSKLKAIATLDFKRAVFLGSGPLFGIARESHLKIQELSDGKVIGKYDSYLGFRHGPRAVVDASTLIVYLLSVNTVAKRYELDLIKAIEASPAGAKSVGIGNWADNDGINIDFAINFTECIIHVPEELLSVLYILPAQIIGFYKSLELGLKPDSPSKGGSISRVVRGVTIY